jgi:RimJ/RimL family protein N-acetyltransferase
MNGSSAHRGALVEGAPGGGNWTDRHVQTPRLLLRRWTPQDAPDLQAACDDPLLRRWLPLPSPYTRADAEWWVTRGWTGTPRDRRRHAVCRG